jgi:transcription initiation factor TFIIIB Brf1 subunit/transcription initiation factor TFIIB
MIVSCPNCENPLRVKKEDKEFICYKCGTIVNNLEYKVIQIGVAKYKFKDDNTEYATVFENEEQGEDFLDNVQKYMSDYKYCTIKNSLGTYKLV